MAVLIFIAVRGYSEFIEAAIRKLLKNAGSMIHQWLIGTGRCSACSLNPCTHNYGEISTCMVCKMQLLTVCHIFYRLIATGRFSSRDFSMHSSRLIVFFPSCGDTGDGKSFWMASTYLLIRLTAGNNFALRK